MPFLIKKATTFRASSIGDCLMGKYFLEQVHGAFPEAQCTLLIGSRKKMISELLKGYPWIHIVEANRRSPLSVLRAFIKLFASDITLTQYSAEGNFSTASKFFARLITKSGKLIGFADRFYMNRFLYDQLIPYNEHQAIALHEEEAAKAGGLRLSVHSRELRFIKNFEVLKRFAVERNNYVLVHLFSGHKGRGLHPESAHNLLRELARNISFPLLLSGSEAERPLLEQYADGIKNIRVIAGETDVQELINLIDGSRAMVSVDTGAAHIAAHLGKKLFVIVSCPALNWWRPPQYRADYISIISEIEKCAPHRSGNFPPCMNEINWERIAQQIAHSIKP